MRADQLKGMDYYSGFLRPMGFGWFAGLSVTTGDDLWCLTFQRNELQGAFLADDQRQLARLSDVASRAATLARQFAFARLDGAVDAAEAMTGACFFIDRFCRVVRMTGAAEQMIGTAVQIQRGHIRIPFGNEALQRHLSASIWPELAPDAAALRPIALAHPGKRPLIFHAIRLRGNALGFFSPAYAMVTVRDLNDYPHADMDMFGHFYRLTLSEMRVAQAIVRHHGVREAATALGISHETARTHAKAIYAKTDTANQMELSDLVSGFEKFGQT